MPEADPVLAAREQRYILLLEKRISELESQMKLSSEQKLDTSDAIVAPAKPVVMVNGISPKEDGTAKKDDVVDVVAGPKSSTEPEKSEEETSKDETKKDESTKEGDSTKTEEKKSSESDQPQSRVRQVIYRWWDDNSTFEDRELSAIKPDSDDKTKGQRAFTFRKVMDDAGKQLTRSEIEIDSDDLRQMLKEVLDNLFPFLDWHQKVMKFLSPFTHFVYMYDDLVARATEQETDDAPVKQTKDDLRQLLKMVKECNELSSYFANRDTDIKQGKITYEFLWTMFPPRCEVFTKTTLGEPQLLQVMDSPGTNQKDDTTFTAELWGYDYNGTEMVRVFHEVVITDKYEGSRPVDKFNYYPLKYFKDSSVKIKKEDSKVETPPAKDESGDEITQESCMTPDELREALIERGLEFDRRCRRNGKDRLFGYDREGLALASGKKGVTGALRQRSDDRNSSDAKDDDEKSSAGNSARSLKVKGPYIADHASFMRYGNDALLMGESKPSWVSGAGNRIEDGSSPFVPTGSWFKLCPPRLLGYATKEKTWAQFKISATYSMKEKESNAFETELQLDRRYKDMLLALVNSHDSQKKVGDMVEDKGNSLVILLHGPPGVGKSLTAETIAEATKKPLIVVSVAEIGLQAERAERNLETMFSLASAWEAILLVDEADVFLETRTEHADPNRNALVSVLLRVLEYYQGVIILTTNRITSIDIAVQSRIHLAIQYLDLTPSQRVEIFKYFLNQVHFHGTQDKKNVERWFTDYACREELNGRQIRNLVASSQALAESKKNDLDEESMRTVMALTQDFSRTVRERTMLQRAKNEGGRMSAY